MLELDVVQNLRLVCVTLFQLQLPNHLPASVAFCNGGIHVRLEPSLLRFALELLFNEYIMLRHKRVELLLDSVQCLRS